MTRYMYLIRIIFRAVGPVFDRGLGSANLYLSVLVVNVKKQTL